MKKMASLRIWGGFLSLEESSVNFRETAISGLLRNSSQLKVFVRVGYTSIYKTLQVIFGGRKIETI